MAARIYQCQWGTKMTVNLAASFSEHMVSFFGFAFSKINILQTIKWANSTGQQEYHVA